jgi:hypothetical protein
MLSFCLWISPLQALHLGGQREPALLALTNTTSTA